MAQVDTIENKSYISQMDSVFAPLLNEPIPFNRLYDRVVLWAGLDYMSSGDTIEFDHFDQAWYELELCALPALSSLSASSKEFSDTVYISRLRNIAEVAPLPQNFLK